MESDPAIVLLGAVVALLVANLVAVLYLVAGKGRTSADKESPNESNELDARLATMAQEIALLDTEIRHLGDLAAIDAEVARLEQASERLTAERADLLELLAHISEALEREIRRHSQQSKR